MYFNPPILIFIAFQKFLLFLMSKTLRKKGKYRHAKDIFFKKYIHILQLTLRLICLNNPFCQIM